MSCDRKCRYGSCPGCDHIKELEHKQRADAKMVTDARLAMLREVREALTNASTDVECWDVVLDHLEAAERAKGGGE